MNTQGTPRAVRPSTPSFSLNKEKGSISINNKEYNIIIYKNSTDSTGQVVNQKTLSQESSANNKDILNKINTLAMEILKTTNLSSEVWKNEESIKKLRFQVNFSTKESEETELKHPSYIVKKITLYSSSNRETSKDLDTTKDLSTDYVWKKENNIPLFSFSPADSALATKDKTALKVSEAMAYFLESLLKNSCQMNIQKS